MYVHKRQVTTYQGIATLLTIALVLWTVGVHMFTNEAKAANLTSVSDLLTDSEPGGGGGGSSVHTVTFTTPTGMGINEIFTIDFPSGFDMSSLVTGDISMTVGGGGATLGASAGAGQWGVTIGGDAVTLQAPTDGGVASSTELVVTIGSEVGTMITNPTATGSYQIAIGNTGVSASSTIVDGGYARVVIIENVLVTAVVQTVFEFTVSSVGIGADANGTTTTIGSTPTTIPFGVLDSGGGNAETIAQRLNVRTNAANGYVVTAEVDTPLQSSTGADIDGFYDNDSDPDNPQAWQAPSNSVTDEDTWGHWGMTSTDFVTGRTNEFSADTWISPTTSPRTLMAHTGPADFVTSGVGSSTVAYQVEITALQEAGDDYSTTLTYIATPTF